ncbi:MAG: ribonuclease III [Gudongella sp.]|nr:ribonuclease III [Gudongella sp.]
MNGYLDKERLDEVQLNLKYRFDDIELLETALTHSSYANEHGMHASKSNQRLEFLGDTVLGLVVSEYLFMKYPFYPEGELTKIRAKVVSEPSLALAARKINLGEFLLLGKGEENTGGRDRDSILADASEAITGAIFMDSNYDTVREFLLKNFEMIIVKAVAKGSLFIDYKTGLQEKLQRITRNKLIYSVVKEEGPDHNKLFHVDVSVGGDVIGSGIGRNKKEAEQMAAKEALILMGEDYD